MRDFVERHQFAEMFLAGAAEAGAALSFGGQKRIGGDVEKSGPALAERAGNLRDAESVEGEGAAVGFIKFDGEINLFSELLERGGGTGRKQGRIGIEG